MHTTTIVTMLLSNWLRAKLKPRAAVVNYKYHGFFQLAVGILHITVYIQPVALMYVIVITP